MARRKKRADGRFEYKSTVGHKLDGTPIRKSFYSTTSVADAKRQAEQYKAEQSAAAILGEPLTVGCTTFADWSRKWLTTYKKPFVSRGTYENTYRNTVETHLLPYFGNAQLQDVRPADIQAFFAEKRECSESLLKKMRLCLNGIFETAIDNDLLYKNPVRYVQIKSDAVPHTKKALTDQQINLVMSAAMDQRFFEIVFLLMTGLRRGELLGLMWQDVDMQAAVLHIRRSLSVKAGKPVIRPPKWNSYRDLPLMAGTMRIIQQLPRTSLYVFPMPTKPEKSQDPNHFSQRLARFFAKLPEECRCTAHELRHSYASQLKRRGVDIYTIGKLLGHRDIKVTAATYVHLDVESFRRQLIEAESFTFCRQSVVREN